MAEHLLTTFAVGYQAYGAVLAAKNAGGESVPVVPADAVLVEFEAFLNPERVAAATADLARNADNADAGFDVIILPDADFTANEETAVAGALQTVLARVPDSWDGEPNLEEAYHGDDTAQKAEGSAAGVRFALAPRHANMPAGDARLQKIWLEAQQRQAVDYELRTPSDLEAMAHILILAGTGALDDPALRFGRTYSRRVEDYREDGSGAPVDTHIPNVGVHENGQLSRGVSRVASASNPGRIVLA